MELSLDEALANFYRQGLLEKAELWRIKLEKPQKGIAVFGIAYIDGRQSWIERHGSIDSAGRREVPERPAAVPREIAEAPPSVPPVPLAAPAPRARSEPASPSTRIAALQMALAFGLTALLDVAIVAAIVAYRS